jgi:catechol 2,3-dioxygenase-like lactoylglutathione lyase family enzyme
MLAKSPVGTVLPAENVERARTFYTQKLGLEFVSEQAGGVFLKAGEGTQIYVYPYGHTKAEHTVAAFQVNDLDSVMRELRNKGVVFEEYDQPGLKTVNGVADLGGVKGAWFKDTEGNIIALAQR